MRVEVTVLPRMSQGEARNVTNSLRPIRDPSNSSLETPYLLKQEGRVIRRLGGINYMTALASYNTNTLVRPDMKVALSELVCAHKFRYTPWCPGSPL